MLELARRAVRKASHHAITALDLDRDWPGITRLLEIEEWPFLRADLEVSEHQPRSIGLVAHRGERLIGFLTIHHFDDVGYLDLMIIDPEERYNAHLATDLWQRAKQDMVRAGFTSQVAHCTRSTARILRLLGYRPGLEFKLLRRDEGHPPATPPDTPLQYLGPERLDEIIALDSEVFGTSRATWLSCLMAQTSSRFVGVDQGGRLVASACLRDRRENSVCIDSVNALDFAPLATLLAQVMHAHPHKRLECFVRSDSDLEQYLMQRGFDMPAFFREIGPLVELRNGSENRLGLGPHFRSLSWI